MVLLDGGVRDSNATASVDTLTEAKIQADMILVVKNGRIVEQGNHATLLENRGYYFELYSRQYEEETTAKIFS